MLSTGRFIVNLARKVTVSPNFAWTMNAQRSASTLTMNSNTTNSMQFLFHNVKDIQPPCSISQHVARLTPFSAPPAPQPISTPLIQVQEQFEMTSVLRKRRLKMNKHKHKKLRKRTRALRKRLGK